MLMAATAYQPQTDANTTLTTPPRSSLVPFHNGESSMAVSDVTDQSIDIQVVKAPINVNGNNTLSFHYELPSLRPPPHGYEQVTTFLQTAVNTRQNNSDPRKRPNHSSSTGYKAILDCIRQPPAQVDLSLLYKVLRALQGSQILATVFSHPQLHSLLIHSVFRLNILFLVDVRRGGAVGLNDDPSMYDDICACYYHLLVAICSANTTFLIPVFEAIVKQIRYVISREDLALNLEGSTPDSTSDSNKAQLEAHHRIEILHATIRKILLLIPKAKSELYPIISKHYPHVTQSLNVVRNYLVIVLQQWQYCDFIREELLLLVLKKCLEMDVEILIKDDGMAIIDPDINTEDDDPDKCNEETKEAPQKKAKSVLDIANKLDINMQLLFCFLQNNDIHHQWKPLLKFVPILLDVHKSKFVQFCFWFLVERDSRIKHNGIPLYREFVAELMKIVYITISSDVTTVSDSTMISTASYLASFCARARFVDTESIREVVSGLLNWAIFYIQQESYNRNKLFYSVTQAVFYIMCYRGKHIIQNQRHDHTEDDPFHISAEKFQFLFSCPRLNPLHHCLSSVREEFIMLSKEFGLVPADALISKEVMKKKRLTAIKISTPSSAGTKNQLGGIRSQVKVSNPLESFFPFDPYLLKKSSSYIEGYLSWEDIFDEDSFHLENEEDHTTNDDLNEQPRHLYEVMDDDGFSVASSDDSKAEGDASMSRDMDDDEDSITDPDTMMELCSHERWRKASIASEGSW